VEADLQEMQVHTKQLMHSVSFTQIHSGGDDDDACLMGGSSLQNGPSHETFFLVLFMLKCHFWTNVATKKV